MRLRYFVPEGREIGGRMIEVCRGRGIWVDRDELATRLGRTAAELRVRAFAPGSAPSSGQPARRRAGWLESLRDVFG